MSGVICRNFCVYRLRTQTYNRAVQGQCYQKKTNDNFFVSTVIHLDNSNIDDNIIDDNDPLRFRETRDINHLMVPFQCDCCHFQNILERMSSGACHQDQLAILCLWRVILDIMKSRKRWTVNGNRLEGLRYLRMRELMGLRRSTLPN